MLAALSLASLLVVFDDSAVSVALPSLQRDLRLDMDQLEWTLNAYTLGLATVLLLAGKLVDRMGAGGRSSSALGCSRPPAFRPPSRKAAAS
jgi:MFS family permease